MIVVPRPAPHLPRTLNVLRQAGFTNLLPLALSEPTSLPVTIPAQTTALLITSPLGVQTDLPNLPTYCVGEATATAARNAGLNVVYTGSNNGVTMATDITRHQAPNTKHTFAHLHGDHAGMEWHTILTQAGHQVINLLAYKTHRITKLPSTLITTLSTPHSTLVTLLFSAGSASHLANLFKQANIPLIGTAICFSPAVEHAATAFWPQTVTATEPNLASMVRTLHTRKTEH